MNRNGNAVDAANIWMANNLSSGTVTKLLAKDGVNLGTFSVGSFPFGVALEYTSPYLRIGVPS
jgi:hypothetical protein